MADFEKDLRHMKRSDLVEIIYSYQQNEKALQEENAALRKALADRKIKISEAGSVAEAALSLNGVFEAAQAAADQYLEVVHSMNAEAENSARAIIADAQKKANAIKAQTQKECSDMKKGAEEECRKMRDEVIKLIQSHEELEAFLKGTP